MASTATPIDALDSAALLRSDWQRIGRTVLKPGHWLHLLHARGWEDNPLHRSFTWEVVGGGDGLLLRADGLTEQLALTQDLADDLIIYTPSTRVSLANYLEVLSWWRACKWGPCLLDDSSKADVTVTADRYGSRRNTRAVGFIPAADLDQPEVVWLHLVEMLYSLMHPGKAKARGYVLSPGERAAFIREMRRKVAKLGIS